MISNELFIRLLRLYKNCWDRYMLAPKPRYKEAAYIELSGIAKSIGVIYDLTEEQVHDSMERTAITWNGTEDEYIIPRDVCEMYHLSIYHNKEAGK